MLVSVRIQQPASPLHRRVSTGGTSEHVRNELFMLLDCNNYRHFITEEEASQPNVSYLLLGKHLIFNNNLLCEVKCNF